MAIDGVKILESDLAQDIYNEFMDLYDANIDMCEIKKRIEKWKAQGLDEIEYEIFSTAYGLALWEVGELLEDQLQEIEKVVQNESLAKLFLEEFGEIEYEARKKEVQKLLKKISKPKSKIRKRKKYKKISKTMFLKGDLFYIKDQENVFYCGLVYNIDQYRGKCYYHFAFTDYIGSEPISIEKIQGSSVYGRKIPSGQKTIHGNYVLGIDIIAIEHKDLILFGNKLKVFGNVNIKENYSKVGSIGFEDAFDKLCDLFINSETRSEVWNSIKIPIEDLIL